MKMNSIRKILQNVFSGWKSYLLFFVGILVVSNSHTYAQTNNGIEAKLKAAYIFHFLQFVEWPDSAFANENSPIVLAVLGKDPFGKILDETIESEKIGKRQVIIKRIGSFNELGACHVLYISTSEGNIYKNILKHVGVSPVLTISDIDNFGLAGGDINFYIEENKVRFAINVQGVKESDLKISSKLLRLAKIINPL